MATSQNQKKKPRVAEAQDKTHFPTKTEGFRSFLHVVFESHPCMTKTHGSSCCVFLSLRKTLMYQKDLPNGGWMAVGKSRVKFQFLLFRCNQTQPSARFTNNHFKETKGSLMGNLLKRILVHNPGSLTTLLHLCQYADCMYLGQFCVLVCLFCSSKQGSIGILWPEENLLSN